jgi:hypothetical protein
MKNLPCRAARPSRLRSARRPLASAFPLVLALTLALSCENLTEPFSGTERVLVVLPEPLPAWRLAAPGLKASYAIRWRDGSGSERARVGVENDTTIELDRGAFTPILLEMESERAGIPRGFLPRAGALYPVHARREDGESTLEADWLRGVDAECAELARTGSREGFAVGTAIAEHLNWAKFDAALSEKANPLLVDGRAAAEAILSGKMRVYDVEERSLTEVSVGRSLAAIPPSCGFLPSWALAESAMIETGPDGSFAADVPAGTSRWFCESGILTVTLAGKRIACAFFTPYGLRE